MPYPTIIASLAAIILCAGCRENAPKATLPQAAAEEMVLTKGKTLDDANLLLRRAKAEEVTSAYPLPWQSAKGAEKGYHVYFNLTDGTCVQLQVDQSKSPGTVVGLGVGPKGRPYTGKIEWFADEEAGVVSHPHVLKLDSGSGSAANQDPPAGSEH